MKLELSIIVITLNEAFWLPKLLESIKRQDYKDYEIIVADYNSIDKTREIAKDYGCRITDGGNYAIGRNKGAKIARGNYLLFLDADCILPEHFLDVNLNVFKNSGEGVGTTEVKPLSKKYSDIIFFRLYDYWSKIMSHISPHCCGASIFVRKGLFDKEGGFNERIVFAENHEFSNRLKSSGFIILPKPIYTSVRRLNKEGRLKFMIKYIYAGLYRIFYKEINKELFRYNNKR